MRDLAVRRYAAEPAYTGWASSADSTGSCLPGSAPPCAPNAAWCDVGLPLRQSAERGLRTAPSSGCRTADLVGAGWASLPNLFRTGGAVVGTFVYPPGLRTMALNLGYTISTPCRIS